MRLTIYWNRKNLTTSQFREIRQRMILRFHLPRLLTVNGETPDCDIADSDLPMLEECRRRGFIQIRYK